MQTHPTVATGQIQGKSPKVLQTIYNDEGTGAVTQSSSFFTSRFASSAWHTQLAGHLLHEGRVARARQPATTNDSWRCDLTHSATQIAALSAVDGMNPGFSSHSSTTHPTHTSRDTCLGIRGLVVLLRLLRSMTSRWSLAASSSRTCPASSAVSRRSASAASLGSSLDEFR